MNAAGIAGLFIIVCCLASWWVAKHRELPYANLYFFYGFLFGVVGLAVVALTPARWLGREGVYPKFTNCSNCGATNPTDAVFCEECGVETAPPISRLDNWKNLHLQ